MPELTLDELNTAPLDDRLHNTLRACCAAQPWIDAIAGGRPYADEATLMQSSDEATHALDATGIAAALAGHPRIGDRSAGQGAWSAQEQAGVSAADVALRDHLTEANAEYERRFGQVYLVCATGKSGEELLGILQGRLGNSPDREQEVVRGELAKINRLRLSKLLRDGGDVSLSTHG
ncbi:MAG: 2-oxo-4-hydroxy-4-carboxy-5-ureidoimidazoline decarboxylase [Mycobacteriales bacterium]